MPPEWVGLETGGKAADKEHGTVDCSVDTEREAWVGGNEESGKVRGNKRKSSEDQMGFWILHLKASIYFIILFKKLSKAQ